MEATFMTQALLAIVLLIVFLQFEVIPTVIIDKIRIAVMGGFLMRLGIK